MCAMALVHSRVRRVVFVHPDPERGMLGAGRPARRLHCERSLNHRYVVFCLHDAARLGAVDDGENGAGGKDGVEPPPLKRARG